MHSLQLLCASMRTVQPVACHHLGQYDSVAEFTVRQITCMQEVIKCTHAESN